MNKLIENHNKIELDPVEFNNLLEQFSKDFLDFNTAPPYY